MHVAAVNSSTIMNFVDNEETFEKFVREWLDVVDEDGDGMLSLDEIRGAFRKLQPLGYIPLGNEETEEMCGSVFERFDEDRDGFLNGEEFKSFMTEIMNALARGIGDSPLIVVHEQGSFLSQAVQHQSASHNS